MNAIHIHLSLTGEDYIFTQIFYIVMCYPKNVSNLYQMPKEQQGRVIQGSNRTMG